MLTAATADQLSYGSEEELYQLVKSETEQAVRRDLGKSQTPLMILGSAAAGIALGTDAGQQLRGVSADFMNR